MGLKESFSHAKQRVEETLFIDQAQPLVEITGTIDDITGEIFHLNKRANRKIGEVLDTYWMNQYIDRVTKETGKPPTEVELFNYTRDRDERRRREDEQVQKVRRDVDDYLRSLDDIVS